jgi:hypothetical protein
MVKMFQILVAPFAPRKFSVDTIRIAYFFPCTVPTFRLYPVGCACARAVTLVARGKSIARYALVPYPRQARAASPDVSSFFTLCHGLFPHPHGRFAEVSLRTFDCVNFV